MKKLILMLCVILALGCTAAFAEEISGKVTLLQTTAIDLDEAGNEVERPVKVTLEVAEPVKLTVAFFDKDEGYVGMVSRNNLAAAVSVRPANRGPHHNLNEYTDEMLKAYVDEVAKNNFEPGYTYEVAKSEGGNTYVAITDGTTRSISTIYDDFFMEIYQLHADENGVISGLTEEDNAFALEIFQGIWTE
jgi:hypothetical protein